MEISDRYIIVSSVGLIAKGWRILDLEKTEFVDGLYSHKPVNECLALNKKKNGVTVIEHAAQQSVHPTSACCRAEIIPGVRQGEPSLCANCGGICG